MVETIVSTAIPVLMQELTPERIEKAVHIIMKGGRKVSDKVLGYLEKQKEHNANAQADEIPTEVLKEVKASLEEILQSEEKPVYMGGIVFFCERSMDEEVQNQLEQILTNISDDTDCIEWESEQDAAYQNTIDDFMWKNYGCAPDKNERDYQIEALALYLNLAQNDDEDYYRLYDDMAIRTLADALNHLLGERYFTGFTTY